MFWPHICLRLSGVSSVPSSASQSSTASNSHVEPTPTPKSFAETATLSFRAHQFHRSATYGGGSMSLEEAQVLCSLVQIIKPEHALETGCESGFSAAYMALGCSLNGFGKVHTIDLNPEWAVKARELSPRWCL